MKFCFRRSQRVGKMPAINFFLPRLISILQAHKKLFLNWTLNPFLLFPISVCGPPAVPVNAKVQTKTSDGLIEARYDCDSGYELFGPATIRCDPHKGWEKELPFCGRLSINPQSRGFDILDAHQNGNLQETTNKTLLSIAGVKSLVWSDRGLFATHSHPINLLNTLSI